MGGFASALADVSDLRATIGVMDEEYLFRSYDLTGYLDQKRASMLAEIEHLPTRTLTGTSAEELAAVLAANHSCPPVTLRYSDAYQDNAEIELSVDEVPDGGFRFPFADENTRIPGTRYTLHIPFDGERELFYCQGPSWSSSTPRAVVANGEIVFVRRIHDQGQDATQLRAEFDRRYKQTEQSIREINAQVERFNQALVGQARVAIDARRAKLTKSSEVAAALGFPMKRRADAPQTYSVSLPRKRLPIPTPPTTPATPPDPALAMNDYEEILKIIESMALMLERSPDAFRELEEEELRFFFLVYLNGQYEGRATGETFNFTGKTDILINDQGKNIFIAECKFWSGPAGFTKTIDQLLGYLSWRDTKTAILIFNRDTQMSTVVRQVPGLLQAHPLAKGTTTTLGETKFRATFQQPNDPDREVVVTALVFDVPRKQTTTK